MFTRYPHFFNAGVVVLFLTCLSANFHAADGSAFLANTNQIQIVENNNEEKTKNFDILNSPFFSHWFR